MEKLQKIKKHDSIQLLKCSKVKKFIKESQVYLQRYKIEQKIKNDQDFFYLECLITTLKNKESFEGTFVKIYDDMIDYWQTLNYEERKRLVNVDMESTINQLPYVLRNNEKYYLPCFNAKMNAIYRTEMVLFELKQYNRLRFDCKDLIEPITIDLEIVHSKITSLTYIGGESNDYYAYCEMNHQIYHFVKNEIVDSFPVCQFNGEAHELTELVSLLNDEDACVSFLIEKNWISEKMNKKMLKKLKMR